MARRKAARKAGKQAARKSVQVATFPADRLPAELIHMVFRYLKATEAAGFRWAGRVVAEIGLEYLAPTVHLALKEKSYDRLLAIAEHPIVSKSVRCLHYEADTFKMQTRDQWELRIIGPAYLHSMQYTPKVPKNDASSREWRAYNREISTMLDVDAPFAVPWDLAESRERTAFKECLQKGQLVEILMSAPDLTSMEMGFGHCDALDIMPLKDIIRDFHWSSLKVISFFSIAVEEEHLLGFCRRHSATLKDLSLGNLLMNGGSWYSTFQEMRQVLKLEDADIYGTLRGGDVRVWQMDPDIEDDDVEEAWYSAPGFIIGQYLLAHDGKDISLEEYLEDVGLA
ncbi:MAG: hypothetical protein ASARMPRED_000908 [Alectoria sarmentosa]|nr:MAG: hypothetical protein ASARMPRED_000908 [Alectoria sarmentosa]